MVSAEFSQGIQWENLCQAVKVKCVLWDTSEVL